MAMKITNDCIACGACEPKCPVGAISEISGTVIIDPLLCNECEGYHESPQCVSICPFDDVIIYDVVRKPPEEN